MLRDSYYFQQNICLDMNNSYYWSDDWSEVFYIELAKAGFISTSHETQEDLLLLPELQHDYALLDFEDLHISRKVKKLLNNDRYELCINTQFSNVINNFSQKHKYNWLKGKYVKLLHDLYLNYSPNNNFQVISVELIKKDSKELIAGEVGYIIGKTYTSLSGFSSQTKEHNNSGTLQLVLLAQYLKKNDFAFWNLGHPHMTYKQKLGCKVYARSDFLKRWNQAIKARI